MPYYQLIAAKHPPHRSLRISQQQKHQQIICCGSSEAHGEYSRIWRNALTQRADDELVALGNRGNTNRAVANAATISKGYDEARSVFNRRSK